MSIPARIRFLSCEPLLGPLNLEDLAYEAAGPEWAGYNSLVDWVIIGGESGPGARVFELDWATSIINQCKAAGVSVFTKQLGSKPVVDCYGYKTLDKKGGDPDEWPEELRVREFPTPERVMA